MSLTERVANTQPSRRRKFCGIKRLYSHLEVKNLGSEAIALGQLVTDEDRTHVEILKILKEEGYGDFVSIRIIEKHRSGVCACR